MVSLALVGKWFARGAKLRHGDLLAAPSVAAAVLKFGWRTAWSGLGVFLLLVLLPLAGIFALRARCSEWLLFNESIRAQRGFDASVYYTVLVASTMLGLLATFGGGWLATRWPIQRVSGLGMAVLAAALVALPLVKLTRT